MPGGAGAAATHSIRQGKRLSSRSLNKDILNEVEQFEQEVAEGGDVSPRESTNASPPQMRSGPQDQQNRIGSRSSLDDSRNSTSMVARVSERASITQDAVSDWVDERQRSLPPWLKRCIRGFQKFRKYSGRLVNDDRVQLLIVIMIAINAIMMGIGTFDFVSKNPEIEAAFEKTDTAFLIIFTIELSMQFLYHGFRLFLDGWLVFDFIIILLSWAFASAQIIRAFRIFRALRLITRVEVMRNLIVALFSVMPRMAAIGILLFLIFYIFAVMFTSLFKGICVNPDENSQCLTWDYFGRLDGTFFTLFQIMTLDEWSSVARETMETYTWAWAPFVAFVIISGFVVVNLIIAVICDAIAALHDDARAMLHGDAYNSDDESDEAGGGPGRGRKNRQATNATKAHIDSLEKQIEDLLSVQKQSIRALETLTQHVEEARRGDAKTKF